MLKMPLNEEEQKTMKALIRMGLTNHNIRRIMLETHGTLVSNQQIRNLR